jgi:hypothetical protein
MKGAAAVCGILPMAQETKLEAAALLLNGRLWDFVIVLYCAVLETNAQALRFLYKSRVLCHLTRRTSAVSVKSELGNQAMLFCGNFSSNFILYDSHEYCINNFVYNCCCDSSRVFNEQP